MWSSKCVEVMIGFLEQSHICLNYLHHVYGTMTLVQALKSSGDEQKIF